MLNLQQCMNKFVARVYCLHVNYLLTLRTYSLQQSPSWEANRFLASQEIPRTLWNPKFITAFTCGHHLSLSWASSIWLNFTSYYCICLHSAAWICNFAITNAAKEYFKWVGQYCWKAKLSVNVIPPTLLLSVLRSIVDNLTVGYILFTGI